MSKKYSNTTADYLSWEQNLILIRKLFDDKNYKMSLLISMGSFWGLRISDLLRLRWEDVLDKDTFTLAEKKTGKPREIKIIDQLQRADARRPPTCAVVQHAQRRRYPADHSRGGVYPLALPPPGAICDAFGAQYQPADRSPAALVQLAKPRA